MGHDGKLRFPDINDIRRSGRLARVAELAYLPDGLARLSFQMACSVWHGSGEKTTDYLSVKAWGKTAEKACGSTGSLREGAPVIVSGKLVIETGKEGDKVYPTIYAFRIISLDWDPEEPDPEYLDGVADAHHRDSPYPDPVPEEEEDNVPF